ncbi:hypothetical protein [Undibacterium flavidum]|uniref:Uncharacterized protein n=1 Tax=Undibacterium flavidum TaxID=2762297 RepID=A0ABR6YD05_9BURK|nr:hypothetical protein [Undibacterium flavidum]MBC3874430.1 hypothetical protein [Undibacterium flavidum]
MTKLIILTSLVAQFCVASASGASTAPMKPAMLAETALVAEQSAVAQNSNRILVEDMQKIAGTLWRGKLTYLDYSANVLRSIPSNLLVAESKDDSSIWLWSYGYDDEPHANAKDGIKLSADGRQLGDENLIERRVTEDGTLILVTSMSGQDDKRQAQFRFTYTITKNAFTRQKEVKLESGGDYFVRHTYAWTR